MTRTQSLKAAKSNNPRWLDATRAFYAESFGATLPRGLRAAQDDWTDLTEEERTFALAHLQYLGLMAQAGTQRLLVQICDVLEEIAEGFAADRETPDEEGGEDDDEEAVELGTFEPQLPPGPMPEPAVEVAADEALPNDAGAELEEAAEPEDEDEDKGDDEGRAA